MEFWMLASDAYLFTADSPNMLSDLWTSVFFFLQPSIEVTMGNQKSGVQLERSSRHGTAGCTRRKQALHGEDRGCRGVAGGSMSQHSGTTWPMTRKCLWEVLPGGVGAGAGWRERVPSSMHVQEFTGEDQTSESFPVPRWGLIIVAMVSSPLNFQNQLYTSWLTSADDIDGKSQQQSNNTTELSSSLIYHGLASYYGSFYSTICLVIAS